MDMKLSRSYLVKNVQEMKRITDLWCLWKTSFEKENFFLIDVLLVSEMKWYRVSIEVREVIGYHFNGADCNGYDFNGDEKVMGSRR